MNFTALLDTAIGLTLVYLGAALFVTIANESIAGIFNSRGKMLYGNVKTLLGQTGLDNLVQSSPIFKAMMRAEGQLRSYVDPQVLAQTLIGTVLGPNVAPASSPAQKPDLRSAIQRLPESDVKSVLWTLAQSADDSIDKLSKGLSHWIDRSLTVLGEGYKRRVQVLSFCLGLVMAIGFNIDTLWVTQRLYRDKELRESIAMAAEQFSDKTSREAFDRCRQMPPEQRMKTPECAPIEGMADAFAKRAETFGKLPIGWESAKQFRTYGLPSQEGGIASWFARVLGWLLTALAVSVGAPFWFDLLNRFVNIRSSIRKPSAETAQK
jgi:hypothetical protein